MPGAQGRPLLKFAAFAAILGIGFATLMLPSVREQLVPATLASNLERLGRHPAAAPAFVLATALLTGVGLPGTVPILVAGAVFGTIGGGLLAWAGLVGGAAVSFGLTHTLARDLVSQLLGRHLGVVERNLQRFGFWAMLRLRFLPIPYAIVNYSVCLAGVRFPIYIISTATALLPTSLVYAYFSSSLIGAADGEGGRIARNLLLAVLFLFLLTFLPPRISAWLSRRSKSDAPVQPPPRADRS